MDKKDFNRLNYMLEAANVLPAKSQTEISDIPWRQVIGVRNQLMHGYVDISYRIIWSTANEDIPKLIVALKKALQKTQ